jgi:hypothetical protein
MTYEMAIAIVACIALSASVCACGLWWYEAGRIDELERDMANMHQCILMVIEVIRRIEKRVMDDAD